MKERKPGRKDKPFKREKPSGKPYEKDKKKPFNSTAPAKKGVFSKDESREKRKGNSFVKKDGRDKKKEADFSPKEKPFRN